MRGTLKNMVDTLSDLSREEKTDLYDPTVIWGKGRSVEENPCRATGDA